LTCAQAENAAVTPNQFRRLALSLPGAVEAAHMGHADFRIGGRIFATLGHPDPGHGMVQLKPDQQALLVTTTPEIFAPVPGGWGRRGSTHVRLAAADTATVRHALIIAWSNRAPEKRKAECANAHPARRARTEMGKSAQAKKRIAKKKT
jgi:hypothetical protein